MSKIYPVYIAFGANLANPTQSFNAALIRLEALGFDIQARSGLWQSPAWPAGSGQPDYINAVVRASFTGDARQALAHLHTVEAALGRVRGVQNAARMLDLDLLDFGGQVIDDDDIIIPHPRMMTRGFVLFPLSQLSADWVHPVSQRALREATARLPLDDVAPMQYLGPWVIQS
ncbi:2-amino-4-hydroxy-6-hydroxymethyldihydropteridine diphosphokinase [Fretibacter rubidus]|uniref:2-amino-4-hydroxy-6- hydroxymethyldihydropteridine diphosphokinase n=1 Tax=Fretibacter rubidus TaxID=570162 RepID=UPI00352B9010